MEGWVTQYSAGPLAWGTGVALPHLASHPSWVGTEAALAGLERNRANHKTPREVAGEASPGAGIRQGCGLCVTHHSLAVSPQAAGQWQKSSLEEEGRRL